jgi:segregation and condensation protein A
MTYKVTLPIFEGPLDLLLYLIKKDEIDISDIPISKITDQYLEYLEMMQLLDLNIAGEFLVMAATLMHIKSMMLLPPDPAAEEEAIEEDPRAELVKRLLEYKKFKEAAGSLTDLEKKQRDVFTRQGMPDLDDNMDDGFEANIFDLITAFVKVVKNFSKEDFHKVVRDEFTVSQKIHDLYHMLVEKPVIIFTELFRKAKNRLEAITIFLALLELIRLNEVKVVQRDDFEEIEIIRNTEILEAPDMNEINRRLSDNEPKKVEEGIPPAAEAAPAPEAVTEESPGDNKNYNTEDLRDHGREIN